MTQREDLLLVGEIGKPHGVSGEVYVVRISDDPRRFEPGARLVHEEGRQLTVESSRPHRNRFLVKFRDVDSREEAEVMRGPLYVSSDEARELDADEFWEHEIAGCEVELVAGDKVGRIARVVEGPAQDLLVVDVGGDERLVPFVKEIVVEVDMGERKVVIDPPPGLLE